MYSMALPDRNTAAVSALHHNVLVFLGVFFHNILGFDHLLIVIPCSHFCAFKHSDNTIG